MEQEIEEARSLTLLEKCEQTLDSIRIVYLSNPRDGVSIPYAHRKGENRYFVILANDRIEDGMAYGCTECEAPFVYEYLFKQGWIDEQVAGGPFRLSALGYAEVDRLRRGASVNVKTGFLVRRWDQKLDEFLDPVMAKVSENTGCKIEPVWGEHHNDRIDERIFRQIQSASVVVLHVDKTRFNVGLEAGYALALRKPVIAIREKPKTVDPLPFDIATLNCYDYETTSEGKDELIKVLAARVQVALEEAKLRPGAAA
jgi:hypothetical protein